jgi:hypothetical protein
LVAVDACQSLGPRENLLSTVKKKKNIVNCVRHFALVPANKCKVQFDMYCNLLMPLTHGLLSFPADAAYICSTTFFYSILFLGKGQLYSVMHTHTILYEL